MASLAFPSAAALRQSEAGMSALRLGDQSQRSSFSLYTPPSTPGAAMDTPANPAAQAFSFHAHSLWDVGRLHENDQVCMTVPVACFLSPLVSYATNAVMWFMSCYRSYPIGVILIWGFQPMLNPIGALQTGSPPAQAGEDLLTSDLLDEIGHAADDQGEPQVQYTWARPTMAQRCGRKALC
jgi:hypothetical protein